MTLTETSSLEETLNAYIADEFFANVQYKMAKAVAKGKALSFASNVFGDNGDEEDEHFDEIVDYAQSLNIPVQVNIEEMKNNCTTPFVEVHDGDTTAQLVSILIAAEKKAIDGYGIGLKNEGITGEHPELIQFFGELLNDERGHLKELEDVMSNIEAEGKTVPQASTEQKSEDEESSDEIGDIDSDENDDENVEETNESLEYDSSLINDFKDKITSGSLDPTEVSKSFITFLDEDVVSNFADYYSHFNTDLARSTSNDEMACKQKFIEMIEDDMIDPMQVLSDLLEFVEPSEVQSFVSTFGYDDKTENSVANESVIEFQSTSLNDDGMTFSKLFKSIKMR